MRFNIILLAVFALLAVSLVFAEESGPSNTVGFISWNCPVGEWTPFAFPFTYYTTGHNLTLNVNEIVYGNFTPGDPLTADRIYDQNTALSIYYTLTGWTGDFTQIVPGHAYWAKINNSDVLAITAGEVDLTSINLGMMSPGWNAVGLREPGVILLTDADLISSGFTGAANPVLSDRVYDQNLLSFGWYNTATSSWVGLEEGLEPGHGVWIWVHPDHSGFEWIYTPSGTALVPNSASLPGSAVVKKAVVSD
jgi:hypothetical protein